MRYKIEDRVYDDFEKLVRKEGFTPKPTGLNLIKWIDDPKSYKEIPEDATEEEKKEIEEENKQIRQDNIDYRFNRYESKETQRKRLRK